MKYLLIAVYVVVMLNFGGAENQLFLTAPVGFITMYALFVAWEKIFKVNPTEDARGWNLLALLAMVLVWMFLLIKFNTWVTS
jgi:divalent metal cation (Fe/Co/Zn/Cd) transporter